VSRPTKEAFSASLRLRSDFYESAAGNQVYHGQLSSSLADLAIPLGARSQTRLIHRYVCRRINLFIMVIGFTDAALRTRLFQAGKKVTGLFGRGRESVLDSIMIINTGATLVTTISAPTASREICRIGRSVVPSGTGPTPLPQFFSDLARRSGDGDRRGKIS